MKKIEKILESITASSFGRKGIIAVAMETIIRGEISI